jgi:endonuclease/exonuclease/phosphatase family metal-dependent hydrolase
MKLARRSFLAWTLAILATAPGCGDGNGGDPSVKVMTQNVYYGFDVGPLMAAASPDEIPVLAALAFQQLVSTDFPARAAAIADKIALERPHLVGLQEVALYRIQSPGDAVIGGAEPATAVLFDHLQILLDALAARGAEYAVAGKVQNVDIELPMIVSEDPLAFDDIRLTDFDVVLARADVAVSNVTAANFAAKAVVPSLGLEIPRGYVALDADLGGGRVVRFANAHLEDTPFDDVQLAQAAELAGALSGGTRPVVLVGDFNSSAPTGATYGYLGIQGYLDAWLRERRGGEGLTWGHDADLRNATVDLTQRLDLVLVRPAPGDTRGPQSVRAEVWGDELDERTASGLWPSDHAGLIVRMILPQR